MALLIAGLVPSHSSKLTQNSRLHIHYDSFHDYLTVQNHICLTLWNYTFRQRTQLFGS